ncbi:DUF397 domain-containing protein [Saccharothrix variisporea]|uniref:Uncharacterized protein DUF397 n=1 Tax=Saccharothrix variisporea TaxID=543527 RepID=A0A495X0F7_9PSEU|nr:DUF397 domain-containing protein [Saccharothrix variisporea]RKT67390.1 uncharacterized protein DUF397 [Saccharothrix variisporea]
MTRSRGIAVLNGVVGRKSSYTGSGDCVVVAAVPHCAWVGIRDSKLTGERAVEQTIVVPLDRFRQFVDSLR